MRGSPASHRAVRARSRCQEEEALRIVELAAPTLDGRNAWIAALERQSLLISKLFRRDISDRSTHLAEVDLLDAAAATASTKPSALKSPSTGGRSSSRQRLGHGATRAATGVFGGLSRRFTPRRGAS